MVETLTISNWIYGRTRIDPLKKVESKFDYQAGTFNRRYYIYWPELPEFTFTVSFAEGTGTPDTIKDVVMVATDWKGTERRVPLSYDSATGTWTGTDVFCTEGSIYPEMFRIEWHRTYESSSDPVHKTQNSSLLGSGDPSGYVFEGIPSNRLEGVTVELYNGDNQLWPDAAAFDQEATQLTDEMGQYLWMVPNGEWKVRYSKEGYEEAWSELMEVPPVRTEVNQSLLSYLPATLVATYDTDLNAIVLRFSRPVQVSDVQDEVMYSIEDISGESGITISMDPVDGAYSVLPAGSGIDSTYCATTFLVRLSAYGTDGEVSITNKPVLIDASNVKTYANVVSEGAIGYVPSYGTATEGHKVTVNNGTGSQTDVMPGTYVTVTASEAPDGYVFDGWLVDCTEAVSVPQTATATFLMPNADITLTASYRRVSTPTPSTRPDYPTAAPTTRPTTSPTPTATPAPAPTPTQPTPVQAVYDITTDKDLKNGSVKVTSGATSVSGKEVTFTVTPDAGYKIGTVSVTDKAGKKITVKDLGDGKYSFVMPEGSVKIDVTFEAVTLPHVCPADKFTDLDTTLWYHDAVDYVLTNGLMKGVSETEFAPLQTTDRAMLTTILYNVEKRPPVTNASSFEDVTAGKWYADPIAWAQANKVVAGTSETTFEPERHITREQMAVMLYNYAVLKGYDVSKTGTLESYTDADELSGWAETAMCWATANGILKGVSSDPTAPALNPQGESTRVEMAALIMNFLQTFAAEKTAE